VEVYSNCEQVELFLNGTSLGSQSRPADAAPRLWKVPFEPGTLRAVGKNAGQCIAILRANAPAGLILLTATAAGFAPASVTVDRFWGRNCLSRQLRRRASYLRQNGL